MDEVKAHLDGGRSDNSSPADVIATRQDNCLQHGEYVAQQIRLRLDRNVRVPYWLPCPKCREEWEQASRAEAKRFAQLIPGEPSWRLR